WRSGGGLGAGAGGGGGEVGGGRRGGLRDAIRVGARDRAAEQDHRQQADQDDRERRGRGLGQAFVGSEAIDADRQGLEVERAQDQGRGQFLEHVDEHQDDRTQHAAPEQR